MATTGAKFPTTVTTVSSAPWSDNDWTSASNITADDTSYASITAPTYDSPDQSYILRATGFDFSAIPSGSTIDGISVVVSCWYANGTNSGDLAILFDGTNEIGNNKWATPSALTTTVGDTKSLGGTTDTWGATLTQAIVTGSGFGIDLGFAATGANSDVFVDYVTIEVTYTAPAATNISATSQSLTLTEYNASVVNDRNVSANSQSMTLTEHGASVAFDTSIAATSQSMTLTGYNAVVAFGASIDATSQSMTLTAYPASVAFVGGDVSISASAVSLSLVERDATVTWVKPFVPSSNVVRMLGRVMPSAGAEADLYVAAGDAKIASLVICNRNSTPARVRVSASAGGASTGVADYIMYDLPVSGTKTLVYGLSLSAGDALRVYSDNDLVSYSAFGSEAA